MKRIHAKTDLKHERQQEGNCANRSAKQGTAVHCHAKGGDLHGVEADHRPFGALKMAQSVEQRYASDSQKRECHSGIGLLSPH
ncbi:hypothetical protein D3C85_1786250 [compost metagenome]